MLVLKAQNPFINNQGQFPKQVKAKVNLPSGSLFIENGKLVYAFYSADQLVSIHNLTATNKKIDAHAYVMQFINSNTDASVDFLDESKYYENYFLGDKSKWALNVKSYKSIYQNNVYSGIDIKFYIDRDKLKYDIIIAPNADASLIKIKYSGLDDVRLDDGNLYTNTSVNTVKESQPFAYQIINDNQIEVPCIYVLKNNILSFSFPTGYNKNYELIIDPILEFSSYSGSTADNFGYTATYDNFGFLYAGSTSFGTGYPTTIGAYQINYANSSGGTDIVITKYDTTGTQRIFSTYLGGSLDDLPHSMIVNSANELFIYGTTASADFPITSSAFQQSFNGGTGFSPSGIGVSFPNGSDLFVSRLSANGGNLLASTFIGGSGNDGLNTATTLKYNYADEVRGEIDIDQQNNIYIATCTNSNDFPTTNSFQINSNGGQEGCIIKMDNQLTTIIWSTYLGGINDDAIYSLALDKNDDIYVTGGTNSSDFPTSTNAYQDSYQDSINADAFITKISSNGSQVLASSYFGTSKYDQAYFVEIGSTNAIYLFGQTKMTGTQLVNNATYSVIDGGQFISVFDEDLSSVLRSTIVGSGKGTPDISPTAFLVDVCDKIYIAGWGSNLGGSLSTLNLPVSDSAFQQTTDGNDFYLMVLDDSLSTMIYATYYGGSQSNEHVDGGTSRFDKKGIIYQSVCAGCGGNSDFPIEPNPGAVSTTNNSSNCNNGIFKFNFDFPMVVADFNAPLVGCDSTIYFDNLTSASTAVSYSWDFGDGNISNAISPTHNFSQNGLHIITLIASDNNACNIVDTIVKEIYILSNSSDTLQNVSKCYNYPTQIGLLPVNDPTITYFWFPSTNLSSSSTSNPFCYVNSNQQYQLLISNGSCTDTLIQNILVTDLDLYAGLDTSYCNTPIVLSATFSSAVNYIHWSSNDSFSDTLSTSIDLIVTSIDVFYIKVSDGLCLQIDSVEIFPQSINIDVFANDICIGDSTLVVVENLNPSFPIISYNWNVNSFNTSSFIDYPDSNKWYSVEVISADGCIVRDSVFVNVYQYPVIDSIWVSDTIVFKGEEISINIISNDNIIWDDFQNSNFSQNFFPEEKKCYKFEVFNLFNCSLQDSICINVKDVFCDDEKLQIPTAFSPNGDNINDNYYIDDRDGIVTNFKLEIFNRLGQKVFASSDISKPWNGTFKGSRLSPQVFDFYLDLECIGDKKFFHKGNITLVR
jgi:gliding motility-associated-like protein